MPWSIAKARGERQGANGTGSGGQLQALAQTQWTGLVNVPVERLAFIADYLAEPLADDPAVHVVVVHPVLIACVVRRVDAEALHLPRVLRIKEGGP